MIYITGDIHGDKNRFKDKNLKALGKYDTLIILGDFGFIWDGGKEELQYLKWLGKKPFNILFIDGSHENYDLLEKYPEQQWCGGNTRCISGNLRQLMRGQIYEIEDKKIFAFGGGESEDFFDRQYGKNWWSRENPSDEELEAGLLNLNENSMKCDYIITHEAPRKLTGFLKLDPEQDRVSPLLSYLDKVNESCEFEKWFFGKYHTDKALTSRHTAVFQQVLMAGGRTKKEQKKLEKLNKK